MVVPGCRRSRICFSWRTGIIRSQLNVNRCEFGRLTDILGRSYVLHTPEALERLVESYLALGVPEEARKAAAVLGNNYPGTFWYKRAYALIQKYRPRAGAPQPAQAASQPAKG